MLLVEVVVVVLVVEVSPMGAVPAVPMPVVSPAVVVVIVEVESDVLVVEVLLSLHEASVRAASAETRMCFIMRLIFTVYTGNGRRIGIT
ncbi:hypothetical protein GCM10023184_02830 [Flaviaesturariibacter amylovorans]|uniref:Secreted protein n=1 Tax=Flaviaesturariibacter amylovorans TaxID=1084520 RepID=A0ABP8G7F9_9BACT